MANKLNDLSNQNKLENEKSDDKTNIERLMQNSFDKTDKSITRISFLITILLIAFIVYWTIRLVYLVDALNELEQLIKNSNELVSYATKILYDQLKNSITEWIIFGLFVLGLFIVLFKIESQIKNCLDISEIVNIKTNKINKKIKENSKKSE